MAEIDEHSLSRRQWLGLVPTLTASLGTGLVAENASAAETSAGGMADNDLGTRVYNIRNFGAAGDGKTLDTAAVQAAIDACHKDQGGTVVVPAGVFVIGTVEIRAMSRCASRRRGSCWAARTANNITPRTRFRSKVTRRSGTAMSR